ncbi:hypothetical protein SMC26_17470 [Actinomadura fulvescens]|uniref:Outer membrane channel protein CpnT-like N-terminal domain-containing protein n=1 Tax=Actinomadura fulvescens TaxID=46160 RepID=A0ABP6CIY2_9ACTN
MGMQLPGELIGLLGMLGYTWPEADETKLFELGNTWMGLASTLQSGAADADAVAQRIWTDNKGEDFDAFRTEWSGAESASQNLADSANGCLMVSVGLMVAAIVVLALKIQVIVQLIMLAIQIAQAIATAPVTFGASLAQIPIFKTIAGIVIDLLIDQAIQALLND